MSEEKQEQQQKQTAGHKKGMSLWAYFFIIAFAAFLFFVTPITGVIISFIPQSVVKQAMAPYHQDIILEDEEKPLSEPVKFNEGAPYDVLGRESAVCFKIHSTRKHPSPEKIDSARLEKAFHGNPIAEIILVDNNKKQYSLKETSLVEDSKYNDKGQKIHYSIICQRIGRTYAYLPKTITGIFIRPLQPFTPASVIWATRKDW